MAGITRAERLVVAWAFIKVAMSLNLREYDIGVEQKVLDDNVCLGIQQGYDELQPSRKQHCC